MFTTDLFIRETTGNNVNIGKTRKLLNKFFYIQTVEYFCNSSKNEVIKKKIINYMGKSSHLYKKEI